MTASLQRPTSQQLLSPRGWDFISPYLAPKTIGCEVSGRNGEASRRAESTMNDLPAFQSSFPELLPKDANHAWAALPRSTEGNQDKCPGVAPYSAESNWWQIDI